MLRGGDRAVVTVAVVAQHGRGLVEAAEPGFRRNSGPLSGRAAHPLETAVHAAPYRPRTLPELTERARVRTCVRTPPAGHPGPLTTRTYRELHDRDGEERGPDGRDGHGAGGWGGSHASGGHHACGSGSGSGCGCGCGCGGL